MRISLIFFLKSYHIFKARDSKIIQCKMKQKMHLQCWALLRVSSKEWSIIACAVWQIGLISFFCPSRMWWNKVKYLVSDPVCVALLVIIAWYTASPGQHGIMYARIWPGLLLNERHNFFENKEQWKISKTILFSKVSIQGISWQP